MAVCPFPLVIPEDPTVVPDALICSVRCEGTMMSVEELDAYNGIVTVLNSFSFVSGVFMVLTWGMFSVKEKQKITFWLSLCIMLVSFSLLVGVMASGGNPNDIWCKDNTEGISQGDGGVCVFQGVFIVFFALAGNGWWFVSCFDLFCKLVLNRRNIEHYLKYYHIFCWTIPIISTIAFAIGGYFGFLAPRVWCFLGPGSEDAEWIFFYAPVFFMWFVGTALMLAVIVNLLRRISTVEGEGSNPSKYFRYLVLYRQPLMFVLAFSFVWGVFVTFRLVTSIDEAAYFESAQSWVTCLVVNFFQNGIPDPATNPLANTSMLIGEPADITEAGCGVVQPGRIPKELIGIAVFTLSCPSIIIFLIFGLHRENYRLWRDLICGKKDQDRSFRDDSRTDSALGTRTASQYQTQQSDRKLSKISGAGRTPVAAPTTFGGLLANFLYIVRCGRGKDDSDYNQGYVSNPLDQYERQKATEVQDITGLSYEEWESQFLVDQLWGIN